MRWNPCPAAAIQSPRTVDATAPTGSPTSTTRCDFDDRVKHVHVAAHDVDEQQDTALGVPHRPFTELGGGVKDELNRLFRHFRWDLAIRRGSEGLRAEAWGKRARVERRERHDNAFASEARVQTLDELVPDQELIGELAAPAMTRRT